jgi:hypothetical protein
VKTRGCGWLGAWPALATGVGVLDRRKPLATHQKPAGTVSLSVAVAKLSKAARTRSSGCCRVRLLHGHPHLVFLGRILPIDARDLPIRRQRIEPAGVRHDERQFHTARHRARQVDDNAVVVPDAEGEQPAEPLGNHRSHGERVGEAEGQ